MPFSCINIFRFLFCKTGWIYEGLYLYQKTCVNTARTLYLIERRLFIQLERFEKEIFIFQDGGQVEIKKNIDHLPQWENNTQC
jgi:hypothetical protein